MDAERLQAAVVELLDAAGFAPGDARIRRTPERVAEMLGELLAGEGVDPVPAIREGRLPALSSDLVLLRNVRFRSLCEHHLLPFDGWLQIAYLPGESIVGFGRIADLVETVSSRLSLQERLGDEIAEALMAGLDARGALVVVEARQSCLADRGPRQSDADAVSVAACGELAAGEARAEAFRLIALGGSEREDAQ